MLLILMEENMSNINHEKKIPRVELPEGLVQSYDREGKIMTSSFPTEWDRENFEIEGNYVVLKTPINGIKKVPKPITMQRNWSNTAIYIELSDNNGEWRSPTSKELEIISKIYIVMNINNQF